MTLLVSGLFVDSQPQHRRVRALFAGGPPPGTTRQRKKARPIITAPPRAEDEQRASVAP